MKNLILVFLSFISFVGFSQNNPVVIELFTSQGCSSCPAADKNLTTIIESEAAKGQLVYGLSFHVDYWNYIGWNDPYSKAEFTARQRDYSRWMKSETIYTPQMIVNGEMEFVGSNSKASSEALAKAKTQKKEFQIVLNEVQSKYEGIVVSYSLNKTPMELLINAAIVEEKVANDVSRGENSGRKLTHRNVVRSFVSRQAKLNGTIEIGFPKGLSPCSLIVFLQESSGHVVGAVQKNLN